MIKWTLDDGQGGTVVKTFPDDCAGLAFCVELPPAGSNTFAEKRCDEVVIGDRVCHYPGKPGPSLEVTNVETI